MALCPVVTLGWGAVPRHNLTPAKWGPRSTERQGLKQQGATAQGWGEGPRTSWQTLTPPTLCCHLGVSTVEGNTLAQPPWILEPSSPVLAAHSF